MAEELLQSLEKLRAGADITRALAAQMAELLQLREAVQKAEEATARRRPNQGYREITSAAYLRTGERTRIGQATQVPPYRQARQSGFGRGFQSTLRKKSS
jgi:hypothetical protein